MKNLLFCLLAFISIPIQAIEISNFKSGLMCGINKDDMGWVCFAQEEIKITGQSSCISNGNEYKCTWYGYSFDYKDAKPNQKIDCKYWDSKPATSINLEGVAKEPSKYFEFSFHLDKPEGYFVNPQYSVLSVSENANMKKVTQDVSCSSEGVELYKYRFISVYSAGK
ncbi:hypothetical protein ACJJIE_06255 [Microbulbifer sp. TRSA001]|uniref:hypothetical protein n=1 Tax=Microbulbifer sp. TRSA001 TaxID=3243381 RepID=UPI004038FD28